jgi:hypothetical protein
MRKLGILTLSIASVIVIGCGGGGSTDFTNSSNIVKGELLKINDQNQDEVISTALSIYKIDDSLDSINNFRLTNDANEKLYANRALELALLNRKESRECNSGKVVVDDNGNGINKDIDIKFENCKLDYGTINGTIHYNSAEDKKNFDANIYDLKVVLGGKEVYYESGYLKVKDSNIFEELTGYAKDGNKSVTFKDVKISVNRGTFKNSFEINGSLSSSCIDNKWVDITTVEKLEQNSTLDCPHAGIVEVKGDSTTLKAKYNRDESIDIYLDGNLTKSYSSCVEMKEDVDEKCN